MAIGVLNEVEGVTPDLYDQVNAKLGEDRPSGGIVHAVGFADGKMVIFDIWESQEDWEHFERERLTPAISEVAGGDAPMPQRRIFELHDLQLPD